MLAIAMIFMVSLLSANLSASPMHSMDASDCSMQVSCGSCFISTTIHSPVVYIPPCFCGDLLEIASLFESQKSVPATPPPKK